MWKKHNNKPHSVTMEIRGNKGLFPYFRKFKSIIVDERSGIIKIIIIIHKKIDTKNLFTIDIGTL